MHQLLLGISELHSRRIIHRDLKPQNLLLDNNLNVKIADFGLARVYSIPIRPYTNHVVTLWYRAPELLLGASEYSTPIDVWALGCIFVELLTKEALFTGDSELDQIYKIFRVLGTPNEKDWPGFLSFRNQKYQLPDFIGKGLNAVFGDLKVDHLAVDLITKMLIYDPCKRITAKSALKHSYFTGVHIKF